MEAGKHIQVEFTSLESSTQEMLEKKASKLNRQKKLRTMVFKKQDGGIFEKFLNMMSITVNELRKNPKLVEAKPEEA